MRLDTWAVRPNRMDLVQLVRSSEGLYDPAALCDPRDLVRQAALCDPKPCMCGPLVRSRDLVRFVNIPELYAS